MKAKIIWIGIIVAILGTTLIGYGIVIALTLTDPSFALDPTYETPAGDWNSVQRQAATNEKLGWQVTLKTEATRRRGERLVRVTALDREGEPITEATIEMDAFHNARARDVHQAKLEPENDGTYTAVMPIRRAGLWEFRLTVTQRDQVFTRKIRKSIAIQ